MNTQAEFDQYADEYDASLARGLDVVGEDKSYFARGRIAWSSEAVRQLGGRVDRVMDFGCGTGSSTPLFFEFFGATEFIGTDVSNRSLDVARCHFGSPVARFLHFDECHLDGQIDVAYCNGVFHHIPVGDRGKAIEFVFRSLRPGGIFALWENNPWNPGTRYIMSRVAFDREAIMLSPRGTKRLLRAAGFDVIQTDFLFIFPRSLRWFRGLEAWLHRLPIGGQYQVMARKPEASVRLSF
jgi:SAM-dependent methyltransferase